MVVNSWVLILQCTINKQFAICIATMKITFGDERLSLRKVLWSIQAEDFSYHHVSLAC